MITSRQQTVLDCIVTRRSVRHFQDRPVAKEILEDVVRAACQAPSAHNRQPWRFVIIGSTSIRQKLAQAMGADFYQDLLRDGISVEDAKVQVQRSHQRLIKAPAVVLFCLDQKEIDDYPDMLRRSAAHQMMVQSVAMAGQNLLLAAHACGLGGVWICAPLFAPAAVQQALQLPTSWLPQGLVYLGYPADLPKERPRRPLEEVLRTME